MPNPTEDVENTDAVPEIDVQRDFCQDGALAVDDGDRIVPVLSDWIDAAFNCGCKCQSIDDCQETTST